MVTCRQHKGVVYLQTVQAKSCPYFVYQPHHFKLEGKGTAHGTIFGNPSIPFRCG
jgi:hypothetical protein